MSELRVGIIGAAGAVGVRLIECLETRNFPISELRLLATERSAGKVLKFRGRDIEVAAISEAALQDLDLVFIAAGDAASREWAPKAVNAGAVVIDKSNAFRMDNDVPLVVPEVNEAEVSRHKGIIASPNCTTIQLVVALKPIADLAGLESVVVSTYQAVSGTGADAMEELVLQSRGNLDGNEPEPVIYPHPIAFNVLPHCDRFEDNGYTREEMKVVRESRKILSDPDLPVSCTAVRVPVHIGHSESVLVRTKKPLSVEQLREAWRNAPGIVVMDQPEENIYPTPRHVEGRDEVFVGRLRKDLIYDNGLQFWVVGDNLRKGAATNAVQIGEALLRRDLL